MKKYNLLGLFLVLTLVVSFFVPWDVILNSSPESIQNPILLDDESKTTVVDPIEDVSIKTNLVEDGVASFLSGVDTSLFYGSFNPDFWNEFSNRINKDFNLIKKERLDPMMKFGQKHLLSETDTALLFYPFSGPDFLHAFQFFPNANEYILLALEDIGSIPDFSSFSIDSTQNYAMNLNIFLRDIYMRSYFITGNMEDDIATNKVDGVLSTLYWFIKRTNHDIVSVEKITLDSLGNIIEEKTVNEGWNSNGVDGVRFCFKTSDNKLKKLIYFSCDMSDQALTGRNNKRVYHNNPNLLVFLNNMRTCNTFIKAASYMMHHNKPDLSFNNVINVILSKSKSIFQDDTGVPFKYFKKNDWNIIPFGTYEKPIKDFDRWPYMMQEDLNSFFKNSKNHGGDLPFSLGYHWKDRKQNYTIYLKSK